MTSVLIYGVENTPSTFHQIGGIKQKNKNKTKQNNNKKSIPLPACSPTLSQGHKHRLSL